MTTIFSTSFPSKGVNSIDKVDIKPMTFSELIDYDNENCNSYMEKLNRDIKFLQKDISNFDELSFYDFEFINFVKKAFTISPSPKINLEYVCSHCKSKSNIQVTTTDIIFPEINKEFSKIRSVKLNGIEYKIKIPRMGDVKKCLTKILKFKENYTEKLFFLYLLFEDFYVKPNNTINAINNATNDEVTILNTLYEQLSGTSKEIRVNCSTCGERGEVIRVNSLMTDMFRLVIINNKFNEDKIVLY